MNKLQSTTLRCGHETLDTRYLTPQRFLTKNKKYRLEDVLNMPIDLNDMPSSRNAISPTPLDPYELRVHGIGYPNVALEYMRSELLRNTEQLTSYNTEQIKDAEAEIEYQHKHRMEKNHSTMQDWREKAATNPTGRMLSLEDAEGVLQVRAGVSRPSAPIELLARNPEIGGIEIAKATRPFCLEAHILSREALRSRLASLRYMTATNHVEARPYRYSIDEHNHALITKTRLAAGALHGTDLEVVTRESGILYDPLCTPEIPESMERKFGRITVHVAPLDITSYVRVRKSVANE